MAAGQAGRPNAVPSAQAVAARTLATAAGRDGIRCTVQVRTGGHNWQFAAATFADELAWLTGRLAGPNSLAGAGTRTT
ncbi:MAG: hypothetical protein L0I76_23180 [Pseudonocardia sp.]|nr:hypothetical protein [Pseudonocardia sp.]